MDRELGNLRAISSSVFTADFARADRLKAILQLAYEMLDADSIVAYRYDRTGDQLAIIAMPGVEEREVMRGPTPEPIFAWDDPKRTVSETAVWLENAQAYDAYLTELVRKSGRRLDTKAGDDFRNRQLRKCRGSGDLALAKLSLYKGTGQTNDKVGQIFFNFYKPDPTIITFNSELRSAICFVATLMRELLIDELYHIPTSPGNEQGATGIPLRLLHLAPALNLQLGAIGEVPSDLRKHLQQENERRLNLLRNEVAPAESGRADVRASLENAHQRLAGLLKKESGRELPNGELREGRSLLRPVLREVLSRELWRLVCRASLETVETYGGQADAILVLGEKLGCRITPMQDPLERPQFVWLDPHKTVSGYCAIKGKTFVGNDVLMKASEEFKKRFSNEPGVQQYKSLLVVPVSVDGGVRALLRLMSTDPDCFLDKHTLAVQDLALVAGYALNLQESRRRRVEIENGLAFFATGPTVVAERSLDEILRGSVNALGASAAVLWPSTGPSDRPFTNGRFVPAWTEQANGYINPADGFYGIRPDGITRQLLRLAEDIQDVLFCLHVLRSRTDAPGAVGSAPPAYVLQTIARTQPAWMTSPRQTPDGFFQQDYSASDTLPGSSRSLKLGTTSIHDEPHTQVALPFRHPTGGHLRGIVWIYFEDLHPLDWWERLFILGFGNSLAQASTMSDLKLAILSFRHMIPDVGHVAWASFQDALESMAELPLETGVKSCLQTAEDGLFMIYAKAGEVRKLLPARTAQSAMGLPRTWARRADPHPRLDEVLHRAAAVATSLKMTSADFARTERNGRVIDESTRASFTLIYDHPMRPDSQVPPELYTAAVSLLANAVEHGGVPYAVWSVYQSDCLAFIFANGGAPPAQSDLTHADGFVIEYNGPPAESKVPVAGSKEVSSERKTGLTLVTRILRPRDTLSLLDRISFDEAHPNAPPPLNRCQTFFIVRLPTEES